MWGEVEGKHFYFVALMASTSIALSMAAPSFQIPKVSFDGLKRHLEPGRGDDELVEALKDVGGKVGVFAITGLPESYRKAQETLMGQAPECLKTIHGDLGLYSKRMPDGSMRTTYASESKTFPPCLNMADLTGAFDQVGDLVTKLIERMYGKPLAYVTEKTEAQLKDSPVNDHVHVYERLPSQSVTVPDMMVPYHTDNGVFLIITPFPDHELDVKLSDGTKVSTKDVDSGSVLVLMGRGLTEWLFQDGGYPDMKAMRELFHPVPHAVRSMSGSDVSMRTVYARMKVVPEFAVPSTLNASSRTNRSIDLKTFQDIFIQTEKLADRLCPVQLSSKASKSADSSMMNDAWVEVVDSSCEEGSAYCWVSCMELPESCPNSIDATCHNEVTNVQCSTDPEGAVMDPSCKWHCNCHVLF